MTVPSGPYIPQIYDASDPDVKVSVMQAAVEAIEFDGLTLLDQTNNARTGTLVLDDADFYIDLLVGLTTTRVGPFGAGGGVWGVITGTLADQTDLQAALDAKASQTYVDRNEQSSTSTYNTDGTLATKTLADGTVITLTYTAGVLTQSNRVKSGSLTVQKVLGYNSAGQLTSVTRTTF